MANEYDEYKYEEPDRRGRVRGQNNSNRPVWVALLAVGCGTGLLVLVAVAGFGYWVFTAVRDDIMPAQAAADRFLDRLKEGKIDAAYESTSANFRAKQTPAEFADYLKQFETFTRHTSRTQNGVRVFHNGANKRAFVQTTLRAPNNALTCTLVLFEEGGVWKVDQITMP